MVRKNTYDALVEISEGTAEQFSNSLTVGLTSSDSILIHNETLWGEFEYRPDNSYRVTMYSIFASVDEEKWVPKAYVTTNSKEEAINSLFDFLTTELNPEEQTKPSELETIPLRDAVKLLADAGATFVAVPEEQLHHKFGTILYYIPIGVDEKSVQATIDSLNEYNGVTLNGELLSVKFERVLHTDVHTFRRVGLFSQNSQGLRSISIDGGIENALGYASRDSEPTPIPSETVDAEKLIRELINAGSEVIAVEPLLSNNDELTFKVWLPAATGFDIVGSYSSVKIDGKVLDLNWEFVWHSSPGFYGCVPVYVDHDITEEATQKVTDSLSNLELYVAEGCPDFVETYAGELPNE